MKKSIESVDLVSRKISLPIKYQNFYNKHFIPSNATSKEDLQKDLKFDTNRDTNYSADIYGQNRGKSLDNKIYNKRQSKSKIASNEYKGDTIEQTQDEIKVFLLQIREIIPTKEFKNFINYIKILTLKHDSLDRNDILERVRLIFKEYPVYFEEFQKLLLFKN